MKKQTKIFRRAKKALNDAAGRVRHWDRAASPGAGITAGVMLAKSPDGKLTVRRRINPRQFLSSLYQCPECGLQMTHDSRLGYICERCAGIDL